jgi:uncharacterized protein YjbJ (UPF0337 family)
MLLCCSAQKLGAKPFTVKSTRFDPILPLPAVRNLGSDGPLSLQWPFQADESGKETEMNWNQVEGNWEQFKGKVQSKWGKLTNDDLDVISGKRKELAGRIQKAYGKTQEDAEREIDEWLTRH